MGPLNGHCGLVGVLDVCMNLRRKSVTEEDARYHDVAFDLGEPEFDLSEPGEIGRRVVEIDVWMSRHESPDLLRLVGRQIVHDGGQLAPAGLRLDDRLEKADEFALMCRAADARPSFVKRCFHYAMVRELHPVFVAIVASPQSSASGKMTRAQRAASARPRPDRAGVSRLVPWSAVSTSDVVDMRHHMIHRSLVRATRNSRIA